MLKMKEFKNDIFAPDIDFTFEETQGEVDGVHILGKVRGCFFVPDGTSRNERFYPKSLWEKVIGDSDVKTLLKERRMFGTISHEQKINDTALLEGKVSHIITDLFIDKDGRGIGEALILGTPSGKILNTVLRAKSRLFVSSRAFGKFEGQTSTGTPVVDGNSYKLETFDFVIDPGFFQANPSIVESLQKELNYCFGESCKTEGDDMENNKDSMSILIDEKVKENITLRTDLDNALKEITTLKEQVEPVKAELNTANEKVKTLEDENKTLKEKADQFDKAIKLTSDLDLRDENETLIEFINKADKATNISATSLKAYNELGSPEHLSEALDLLEQFTKIGSPEKIVEALQKSKEFIDSYKDLGTPEKIAEVFSHLESQIEEKEKSELEERVNALSEEIEDSDKKEITKLIEDGKSDQDVKEFYAEKKEKDRQNNLKVDESSLGDETEEEKVNEEKKSDFLSESRSKRLLKHFS